MHRVTANHFLYGLLPAYRVLSSLAPRPHPLTGKRVWHTSSLFLYLLTRQFRILDYQSDCRHMILSCENAIATPPHN